MNFKTLLYILSLLILLSGTAAYASDEISYSAQALKDTGLISAELDSGFFQNTVTMRCAVNSVEKLYGRQLTLSHMLIDKNAEKKATFGDLSFVLLEAAGFCEKSGLTDEDFEIAKSIGFFDGLSQITDSYNAIVTYDDLCKVILNCLLITREGDNTPLAGLLFAKQDNLCSLFEENVTPKNYKSGKPLVLNEVTIENADSKDSNEIKYLYFGDSHETKFAYFNDNEAQVAGSSEIQYDKPPDEFFKPEEKTIVERNSVFFWQNDPLFSLPKSEGCYITAIAMAIASQGRDITPYDVYTANGCSAFADYLKISKAVECDILVISKPSFSELTECFKTNPNGTVLTFAADGFSHAVFITDIDEDGNIYCNDPAFENGENLSYDQTWMAKNGISTENIKSIILIKNT